MSKKLIVASANRGKIREIAEILPDYEVIPMAEAGYTADIEETGSTFYENALIKAKTVAEALRLPALADDSGLSVDALHGEPGVYSARYGGDHGNDEKNIDRLLSELSGRKKEERGAKFCSCVVLYFPDGKTVCGYGETQGYILEEREGEAGFGYDPVFFSEDLGKSFGQASAEEKNAVSHRFRAICDLKRKLEEEA